MRLRILTSETGDKACRPDVVVVENPLIEVYTGRSLLHKKA
ncbi:MAG: hypothetical protein V7K43_09695 [Nostoc sp.]